MAPTRLRKPPAARVPGLERANPARCLRARSAGAWRGVGGAGRRSWVRPYFSPAAELPSLVEQQEAEQAAAARPAQRPAAGAANASGPVVFTALEEAWVRFYTPEGTLSEMVMARGDTYAIPANAAQPMLRTGRPDALQITVGGRPVPKLRWSVCVDLRCRPGLLGVAVRRRLRLRHKLTGLPPRTSESPAPWLIGCSAA